MPLETLSVCALSLTTATVCLTSRESYDVFTPSICYESGTAPWEVPGRVGRAQAVPMLPAIAKTPRSTTGKGAPQQSQVIHPPERPVEHVDDWTPHDVAEWLYTRVHSRPPQPPICVALASFMLLVRHRAPRTTTRTPSSLRASTVPRS